MSSEAKVDAVAVVEEEEEEEAWEPNADYDDDEEDFACDMCIGLFKVGDTRYHSTVDNEFDVCAACKTDELEKEHKFKPIVIKKVSNQGEWSPGDVQ